MFKERNDYSGPIEDRVDYGQFSKQFLLKLMAIWQDYWELTVNTFVKIGSEMEGVGPDKIAEVFARTLETVTPPIMARTAELAKVDVNTVEGRCKAGMLGYRQHLGEISRPLGGKERQGGYTEVRLLQCPGKQTGGHQPGSVT